MMEMTMPGIDKRWQEDALCRAPDVGVDLFEDYGYFVVQAKRMCSMCPVRRQCLEENLDEPWGIWGGLNAQERKLYKEGYPILYCEGCGSTMTRTHGDRCMHCQMKPLASALLQGQTELIADLAGNGKTDAEIAAYLCTVLAVTDIVPSHVRSVRRRNGIQAGARRPASREIPRSQGARRMTYEDSNVTQALAVPSGLGELSMPERLELLRRWLLRGGTKSTFARHHKCAGSKVNELLAKLREADLEGSDVS